ncbi:MAG: galactose oxidase-like domain-containing protein, partial [Candidatus Sulfotelmatobacter sp.]
MSGNWTFLPDMNAGRWYPTNTVLPNGDVVVTSGEISPVLGNNPLPQVWQASSGTWRNLTTAQLLLPLYPPMYLAPNGTLFNASPVSRYLNTDGTGSWTIGPSMEYQFRGYGPSVMYNNGQIMLTGGGVGPTATAEVINLNDRIPTWSYTGTMAYARRHANATLLPDGTVLVTGGTSGVPFDDNTNPVYPAELWNPATGTWSMLASLSVYRGYHSVALLLPDGRVLSGGGQCYGDTNCNPNSAEIFSPPYLFAGARPTITSAPASISGGQTFFVATPDAANITQVTWIRLGAVTHTFNQEQR